MSPKVSELWIYPIKSTQGIQVSQSEVTWGGLANDRRWMVADKEGTFLTARVYPRMLKVTTGLRWTASEDGAPAEISHLRLNAPGMETLEVPTAPEEAAFDVKVWSSDFQGHSLGKLAAEWWSTYLAQPCSLVSMSTHQPRLLPEKRMKGLSYESGKGAMSFADAYPILVTSKASLAALNQKIEARRGEQLGLTMERFRPNIVVEESPPFDEDAWGDFQIGGASFHGRTLCDRCVLTTVDPKTGQKGKEPLATMATFRKFGGDIAFGLNVIPAALGTIAVGQRVVVANREERTQPE